MIPKQQLETAKPAELPRILKGMGIELLPMSGGISSEHITA